MEKAILRTLAYADVFNYPLIKEEIWRWLISEDGRQPAPLRLARPGKTEDRKRFAHSLKLVLDSRKIRTSQGFYYLKGRQSIVSLRRKREAWSRKKLKFAEKVAGILRLIPWIKLIGVTGALAMRNADKEDDIDLLIVSSKNRLWLTRGLVVSFLRLTRIYRRPGKIKDKICPNMLLDEEHLVILKKERDLFSAHEVLQMKPLWEKRRTYRRFLRANQWSQEFLPNWKP